VSRPGRRVIGACRSSHTAHHHRPAAAPPFGKPAWRRSLPVAGWSRLVHRQAAGLPGL